MKLKLHEVQAYTYNNKFLYLAWRDKRPVHMLTTYYNAATQSVTRHSRSGIDRISKPTVIVEYTANMGAVDRADHLCTSYNFDRKSIKWWRKLFFWLTEVAAVNSFILFKMYQQWKNEQPLTHLEFRKKLIEELAGDVRNRQRRRGRPSTRDRVERLNKEQHFMAQKRKGQSKDCAVCSNHKVPGERKKTVYFCKTCTRLPGLHLYRCFEKYHTLVDYKN